MARRARPMATRSRPPELYRGGTSRRGNAGDVLASWRSGWRLYRARVAHGVTAGAYGVAFGPQDEG